MLQLLVAAKTVTAPASAAPAPTASALPAGLAAAPIDPVLNGIAKIILEVVWPLAVVAIVALVVYKLVPLIVPLVSDYVALLNEQHALRREHQARLSRASWEYSESVNVTETVATAVAAAVAVRLIKKPKVEETPNFELLRSIVRRMTQSINSGESRALHGKMIFWVHQQHIEDLLEKHVFENLGASVRFFTDNETLANEVRDTRDRHEIVAIISNSKHWDTPGKHDASKPCNDKAARSLLRELKRNHGDQDVPPVLVYSRSLNPVSEGELYEDGADLCTDLPDVLIRHVLETANARERDREHHAGGGVKNRLRRRTVVAANGVKSR